MLGVASPLNDAATMFDRIPNERAHAMHKLIRRSVCCALILASTAIVAAGHTADTYGVRDKYAVGGDGRWDLLAVDPSRHRVFLSRSDRVDVVDTATGKIVGTIGGTDGVHGIAIAAKLGRGYATNGKANSVTEFDLNRLERTRDIPVTGKSPDAVVYEPTTGRVFAFNARSNNVSVIDAGKGTETAVIAFEGNPELAVDDAHGHVFVNIEDTAQLVEIDARRLEVMATWHLDGCESPTGLAIDTKTARLFSTCQNRRMVITDARSGRQVAQLPIGEGPDGAAFDPVTHDAFSADGKSGTLTVVHEDDANHFRVIQNVATQAGARTVAIDPVAHRLYLPTAQFAAPAQPNTRPEPVPGSFTVLVVSR